jgi:hypothetical protein
MSHLHPIPLDYSHLNPIIFHFFRCHLSIAFGLRVRIFIYNGRDDEKIASHSARAMVFDANTTLPVVGIHVTENITWTNILSRIRIPTPY